MTTRTTMMSVTFGKPFLLASYGESLPAGRYDVEIVEERLEGLSFAAYRRASALLHLQPTREHPRLRQTLVLDPKELDEAVRQDQAASAEAVGWNADANGLTQTLTAPDG